MIDEPRMTDEATPPDKDDDTIGSTVPWFFQEYDEAALRAQAGWTERQLGLSDDFYARFLRFSESSFREWKLGWGELPAVQQEGLRNLWHSVIYLLEFTAMDAQGARTLLEHEVGVASTHYSSVESPYYFLKDPQTPPWNWSCLKSYLEKGGPDVLQNVDRYLTSFWAGDPSRF